MIASLLIRLLLFLARRNGPPKVYTGRNTSSPYLTRYFLTRRSVDSEGMEEGTPISAGGELVGYFVGGKFVEAPRWGLYLHCFHRGDDDPQLHNHPWAWAYSLILKGGYSEERREGVRVIRRRTVKPWSLNYLTHADFHRVDLRGEDCWTLFLVGPVVQSWGFWDRVTGRYTGWKEFLGVS